jgi:hypothetical protein
MPKPKDKFAKLELKMVYSKAYQDLNAPTLKMLSYVLLQLRWAEVSRGNYVLSIKEHDLLYTTFRKAPFFMKDRTITRSIDSLLAHGFIKVKEQGGFCQGHKSRFEYTEEWKNWTEGDCIFTRKPFFKRGFKN